MSFRKQKLATKLRTGVDCSSAGSVKHLSFLLQQGWLHRLPQTICHFYITSFELRSCGYLPWRFRGVTVVVDFNLLCCFGLSRKPTRTVRRCLQTWFEVFCERCLSVGWLGSELQSVLWLIAQILCVNILKICSWKKKQNELNRTCPIFVFGSIF